MKPIIIIKETNKNGKFELTEKELKELIEQAYKQGFEDAKQQYQPSLNGWNIRGGIGDTITTPSIQPIYKGEPNLGEQETFPRPHDIYGNPVVYCGDLNQTSAKPNGNIIAWNTATSSEV